VAAARDLSRLAATASSCTAAAAAAALHTTVIRYGSASYVL
jgi:hypothetical protein